MKKIMLLIVTLIGILSWQSCQYEWVEPVKVIVPEVVSFSVDIQPIFDQSCNNAGCHAPGGTVPNLKAGSAYTNLISNNLIDLTTPANSKLYMEVETGGSMNKYTKPGNPEIILKWIEEGALNN